MRRRSGYGTGVARSPGHCRGPFAANSFRATAGLMLLEQERTRAGVRRVPEWKDRGGSATARTLSGSLRTRIEWQPAHLRRSPWWEIESERLPRMKPSGRAFSGGRRDGLRETEMLWFPSPFFPASPSGHRGFPIRLYWLRNELQSRGPAELVGPVDQSRELSNWFVLTNGRR